MPPRAELNPRLLAFAFVFSAMAWLAMIAAAVLALRAIFTA